LHPVKLPQYQYRLHNFFNVRKIIDLRQKNMQLQRDIRAIEKNLLKLHRERNNAEKINKNLVKYESEADNLPKDRFILTPSFKVIKPPKNRQHRYDFTFFTRSIFSSSYVSPKRGAEGYWKSAINDGMRQVMEDINKNSIQKGRIIDFKDVLYGYVRHHPLIGIDYIIDALLVYKKYEGRKMTVPVRRHAYVRQTFTGMFFREDMNFSSIYHYRDDLSQEYLNQQNNDYLNTNKSFFSNNIIIQNLINFMMPSQNPNDEILYKRKKNFLTNLFMSGNNEYTPDLNSTKLDYNIEPHIKDKIIHFVVPLAGRLTIFKRFIENFENICLKTNENVKLAIVLFKENQSSDEDISNEVNKIINGLKYKYLNEHLRVITIKANFSRSVACEIGATLYPSKSLVFFVDVDMIFSREFLLRVRLNTIENKQVYFPIVFSEYDPDPGLSVKRDIKNIKDHFDLNSETGYWRQFGFGIAAAYNSDLRRVGGFDTSIIGWGKEDVDLYEKFVRSNITVFRSVDPGLVHVFHKIKCDPGLAVEQMTMCVGSKSTSIASQRVLANIIFNRKLYLIEPTVPPNTTITTKLETVKN
jgi:chondroitin sulfate synthase